MGSLVFCIHYKEGCTWSDELRKLKGHLNTCKYDAIPCTNDCKAMIPQLLMQDHLIYTCPKRMTSCEYCNLKTTAEEMEMHSTRCKIEEVYCENKCGVRIQRQFLGYHQNHECSKRLAPCRHCHKKFVFDTLKTHKAKCPMYPVVCPNQCGINNILRGDLEAHLNDFCDVSVVLCIYKDAGCTFKGTQDALDRHVQEDTKAHLSLMCSTITKQQYQIATLCSALHELSINATGVLMWKITNYSKKLNDAKMAENYELCSRSFYSSQYGYKLMVTAFPNGNGEGLNTHLSLYVKLIPGDYDAILPWPFSLPVTFTLYDQTPLSETARNVVESFLPDPAWKNFQRPSKLLDELGYGFPKFISHEQMQKRFYVKEDAIFIRIKVDDYKVFSV